MLKLLSVQQNEIQTEDHYIINNELDDLLNKELVELFLKANDCIDDENFIEAVEFYDLILKIDPKYSMALAYNGLSLGELGNLTESISCFKKALSIDEHCTLAQISKDTAQELLKSINSNSKKL